MPYKRFISSSICRWKMKIVLRFFFFCFHKCNNVSNTHWNNNMMCSSCWYDACLYLLNHIHFVFLFFLLHYLQFCCCCFIFCFLVFFFHLQSHMLGLCALPWISNKMYTKLITRIRLRFYLFQFSCFDSLLFRFWFLFPSFQVHFLVCCCILFLFFFIIYNSTECRLKSTFSFFVLIRFPLCHYSYVTCILCICISISINVENTSSKYKITK